MIAGKSLECDVLVVGMGFAGLVTALRASELKAKVIAIDKQPRNWWTPGGNMIISGGGIHLAGHSLAAPEAELASGLTSDTGGMVPPDLLSVTVRNAGRSLKWLIEKGAMFEQPPKDDKRLKPSLPPPVWGRIKPGGTQDAANFGNKGLALKLEALIKENGGTIVYGTKCLKLLTNVKGAVTGVVVQDKDGRFNIAAKRVILCTGGYERNAEMLVKYGGPRADEVVRYCGPGCTGDAFRMCEELGAYLRSMNHLGFSHLYSADAYLNEDLQGAYVEDVGRAGIIVNGDGERFVDESLGERIVGSVMTKTTIYSRGWIIIDKAIYQTPEVKSKLDTVEEFGGRVFTADTIEELAARAGIGPRLPSAISEYNRAVASGKVAELKTPRTKTAKQISIPPFYAIPFMPGIVATYGGFLVNTKAEILDWDKKPIPGLYAAGLSMQGSVSGGIENAKGAYCGCLAMGLIFGILAAENAAVAN